MQTESLSVMLPVLLKMLCLILIGVVSARLGIITAEGRKAITNFVVQIVYPCYILRGFIDNIGMFAGKEMLFALFVSLILSAFVFVLSLVLYKKEPSGRKSILRYVTLVSNTAFLGLPIMENLFGSTGLLVASIFVIPNRINTFGIGVNYFLPKKKTNIGSVCRSVITQPSIVATCVGIVIALTGLRPPQWCVSTLSTVGSCSTPLAMAVIGAVIYENIRLIRLRPLTMRYCLLRLVIIPAVVYACCRYFSLERVLMSTAVLFAAMPAATTSVIYADKYGADAAYGGEVVLMSTLLSVITLPVWSYLCMCC